MPGLFPERVSPGARGRELTFPASTEKGNFKGDSVEFWGQDGETLVRCEITRSALDDHFGGNGKDDLSAIRANRRDIEGVARRRYLAGRVEKDGSVLIDSEDV